MRHRPSLKTSKDFVQPCTSFEAQLQRWSGRGQTMLRGGQRAARGCVCRGVGQSSQAARVPLRGTGSAACPWDQGWLGVSCPVWQTWAAVSHTTALCFPPKGNLTPPGRGEGRRDILTPVTTDSSADTEQCLLSHQIHPKTPSSPAACTRSCLLDYICLAFSMKLTKEIFTWKKWERSLKLPATEKSPAPEKKRSKSKLTLLFCFFHQLM